MSQKQPNKILGFFIIELLITIAALMAMLSEKKFIYHFIVYNIVLWTIVLITNLIYNKKINIEVKVK